MPCLVNGCFLMSKSITLINLSGFSGKSPYLRDHLGNACKHFFSETVMFAVGHRRGSLSHYGGSLRNTTLHGFMITSESRSFWNTRSIMNSQITNVVSL